MPELVSRKEAKEKGLKRFFTGKPCKRGHVCERYIGRSTCIDCNKLLNKKQNPKKVHIYKFCEIYKAAKVCKNRKQFRDEFPQFYVAASKRKILPLLCGHMPAPKTSGIWTRENIIETANRFSIRSEFCRIHPGAYEAGVRLGLVKEMFNHMERPNSDYDSVYMWGEFCGSHIIAKFGVTSERLGTKRIDSVSSKSGIKIDFMVLVKSEKALQTEKLLMSIGSEFPIDNINGGTEFRKIQYSDLTKAYGVIYGCASTKS